MKKILLTFILSLLTVLSVSVVSASSQKVIVSEMVPGGTCWCYDGKTGERVDSAGVSCPSTMPVHERKYECTVEKGLAGFQNMFATIIRWLVNIVMLAGVLAIVGLGIAWSLAGGDDAKAKSELKKWGMNILIGMIILFFFRYILQFLAPWIYK